VKLTRTDITLIVANAVVWGVPTALYLVLSFYQFYRGHRALILLAIGPLPYGAGLLLSTLGPEGLFLHNRPVAARIVAIIFLIIGLPVAALGMILLGSL
jgi:hypothetical protein